MKNILFIFLTFYTLGAFAQSSENDKKADYREDLRFGVKAGFNVSNVYDTEGEAFVADSKAGLALGGFISIPLNKYIGFQPELLLSQKGFTGNGKFLGTAYKFTRTTNHIDVPLLLQFKPARFLSILSGVQYSYITSSVDEFKTEFGTVENKSQFTNDDIQKNLFGLMIGVDFHIGKYFLLSGRAAWDVMNNRGNGDTKTPRYKNQWVQLTAGISF